MRVKSVSFFGLAFNLQNGKWVASKHKKTALIQHDVRFDDRIPVEKYDDKKSKWLQLTTTVIKILAAAAICFACRGFFAKDKKSPLDILVISFALGMVLQALTSLGIFLYTHLVLMKRLGGYVNTLLSRLRNGEELSSLNMQPVEMLPYENPTNTEKILYYQVYMAHLAASDNYEAMREPSHQAMNYIMNHDYFTQETLAYYWLIFYFSEVEPDEQSAKALLEKLGDRRSCFHRNCFRRSCLRRDCFLRGHFRRGHFRRGHFRRGRFRRLPVSAVGKQYHGIPTHSG